MNSLRNSLTVLFMALGVTPVQAAEPAHDHSRVASAATQDKMQAAPEQSLEEMEQSRG